MGKAMLSPSFTPSTWARVVLPIPMVIFFQVTLSPLRTKTPAWPNSRRTVLLTLSSETGDGLRVTQRQIYARSGEVVGILTLSGLAGANQDFIEIVHGASFCKPPVEA